MSARTEKTEILLAFGANLPSPEGAPSATIAAAIERLASRGFDVVAVSSFYRTPAVVLDGGAVSPPYINACAKLRWYADAEAILAVAQQLERDFGRIPSARWTARPLDIDLLACGDAVLPDGVAWRAVAESADPAAILPEPVVPHPRLHIRGFVLAPLLDVAPEWRHPVLGRTVQQLAEAVRAEGGFEGIEKLAAAGADSAK